MSNEDALFASLQEAVKQASAAAQPSLGQYTHLEIEKKPDDINVFIVRVYGELGSVGLAGHVTENTAWAYIQMCQRMITQLFNALEIKSSDHITNVELHIKHTLQHVVDTWMQTSI